jgi:hypothetical protein
MPPILSHWRRYRTNPGERGYFIIQVRAVITRERQVMCLTNAGRYFLLSFDEWEAMTKAGTLVPVEPTRRGTICPSTE